MLADLALRPLALVDGGGLLLSLLRTICGRQFPDARPIFADAGCTAGGLVRLFAAERDPRYRPDGSVRLIGATPPPSRNHRVPTGPDSPRRVLAREP
jgi:hypothetical protein